MKGDFELLSQRNSFVVGPIESEWSHHMLRERFEGREVVNIFIDFVIAAI